MTNEEKGEKILVTILKAKPLKIVRELSFILLFYSISNACLEASEIAVRVDFWLGILLLKEVMSVFTSLNPVRLLLVC